MHNVFLSQFKHCLATANYHQNKTYYLHETLTSNIDEQRTLLAQKNKVYCLTFIHTYNNVHFKKKQFSSM